MANQSLGALTWWRKWAKKNWAIAAVGFSVAVFLFPFISNSWRGVDSNVNQPFDGSHSIDANLVDLTLLHNAKDRGALCLDGSPAGYHFQKGFGSGSNNWLLHIEVFTSFPSKSILNPLGSSKYMERQVPFSGILSRDPAQNPDFFTWNKVKIRYCDGASFAGHPESENGTGLFFRGQLIWEALMDELLSLGLSSAKQALLSGCSAGGLASLIHCDDFPKFLPKDATVKCLSDAGFFLDEKDVLGNQVIGSFYHDVVQLQGVAKSLHKDCIARMEPHKAGFILLLCLFPREIIKNIKTPVFLVNPAYDFWQIQNILVPEASDPHHSWQNCRLNIDKCNPSQIATLQGFRSSLLEALGEFQKSKEGGMFINSCFVHCQAWMPSTWHSPKSPRINNKTIAESVGDWFFNRNIVKQIDCPYPCNPTCHNLDFT
ncbi:hypothetical protein FH972_017385 [Carpinus fangiana]|uniref:Pectin acetylesterase n=1 Tax=Carpinus fangiana TaxID=176857 RepID=A0A5N6RMP5_9ROSI|nr:hypothetical protein FH972_017385 [Carpinus fangiana]